MAQDGMVGSRIRERRVAAGQRQAQLAKAVGISASYLNLIEHNKRRIGGKLLLDIATELGVDYAQLNEGAEANLVASLRYAAAEYPDVAAEMDRIEEFAGRFPGWARLIAEGQEAVQRLQRTAETLSDRMSHDPYLAASMHEVLSMVTAIHSTATILHEDQDIAPDWRRRFVRNINEDSQRLSDSAQALVRFLDGGADAADQSGSPQHEVDQFLQHHNYHFPQLESLEQTPDTLVAAAPELKSASARAQTRGLLRQYERDAQALDLNVLQDALGQEGLDPATIANRLNVPIGLVLRRLAVLPEDQQPKPLGFVVCDAAGTLLFRREVKGFVAPKFSAACAKWPVFEALTRPAQPIRRTIEVPGRDQEQFDCFAVSEAISTPSFDQPTLYHSYMLVVPRDARVTSPLLVGASCRVCPRQKCEGRHTPSVLIEGI
ncbi:helix-turn-helix domain-containing protein [Cognatishimia maritima]|uniref:HTH cro/C1-type domain-containing protein n=1 Tax=Cognatishimia maritima TaxID=870908 RepID=A0A1M5TXS7_9RHOB|nr:helix-turn-helix transcriptional regulator [Cognatishimia maritima]SHH55461.1 hypothetical protein SAMN04488044_2730 [Cognatishimia maritima]